MKQFKYKGILDFAGHYNAATIEGNDPLDIVDELTKIQKSLHEYDGLGSRITILSNETDMPLMTQTKNINTQHVVLDINPIFRGEYKKFYTKKEKDKAYKIV